MSDIKETTALVPGTPIQVTGLDVLTLGKVLAKSGYFRDARDEAQAVVKILFGAELGIGPVAAMTGIYIVEGKPTLSANVIASLIRRSRRYDYRVIERSDERCELAFMEKSMAPTGWSELGRSSWTTQDARRAGLVDKPTWRQYPRAMLFGRALSEGARAYCPDLFAGAGAYIPEELGAEVEADTGAPLSPVETQKGQPAVEPWVEPHLERTIDYWRRRAMALYADLGGDPADRDACRADLARILGIDVKSRRELTLEEWRKCALHMQGQKDAHPLTREEQPEEQAAVPDVPQARPGWKERAAAAMEKEPSFAETAIESKPAQMRGA